MQNDPLCQLTAHAPHASGPIIIRAGEQGYIEVKKTYMEAEETLE